MDDHLRRQLRISMFLQAIAAGLLLIACIARIITAGPDVLAAVFGLGTVLAGGLAWYLRRYLARHGDPS